MDKWDKSVDEDLAALFILAPQLEQAYQVVAKRTFTVVASEQF